MNFHVSCRECGCDLAPFSIMCPLCSTVSRRRLVAYLLGALVAIPLAIYGVSELAKEPPLRQSAKSVATDAMIERDRSPDVNPAAAAAIEAKLKAERETTPARSSAKKTPSP